MADADSAPADVVDVADVDGVDEDGGLLELEQAAPRASTTTQAKTAAVRFTIRPGPPPALGAPCALCSASIRRM
jgi:hypothetical protein